MATMEKWGREWVERFQGALLDAFPLRTDIERLITYGLGEDLGAITSESDLENALFHFLKWAKSRGKLDLLLEQARRRNPDNRKLCRFVEQMGPFVVPFTPDAGF